MNQSESIKALAAALAKAQGQIEPLKTDETAQVRSEKGNYSYKYASLAGVLEVCKKPLSENGLAIIQTPEGGPDSITVVTRLIHSSGEWIESSITLRPSPATPQGIGSAITYGRRYSAMAILGIAPEDDDGQAASQPVEPTRRPQPAPARVAEPPEARKLVTQILNLQNTHSLSNEEVLTYGQLSSLRGTSEAGDIDSLKKAYSLLQEYVNVKQKEMAEAG